MLNYQRVDVGNPRTQRDVVIIPQPAPSSPASSRRSWRWNQLAAAPLGGWLPEGSTSQRNQVAWGVQPPTYGLVGG